jgi:hypothetical protein
LVAHVRQNQLTIGSGARATIRTTAPGNLPTGTSRLSTLSIDGGPTPTGTLDLSNNALVLDYNGAVGNLLNDTLAQIRAARNGSDANDQARWDGPGITSGTARSENLAAKVDFYNLGCVNNADLGALGIGAPYTSFAGQPVGDSTILVRHTYAGDADLNGVVDGDDYTYWLIGFLTLRGHSNKWLWGDFNYDGVVDGDDYTQWLNTFLFAGPPLGSGAEPIPEPGTAVLLAVGAMLWLHRTRHWQRGVTDDPACAAVP